MTRSDRIAPWSHGVSISPVCGELEGHSIHTYFNTSPESPDGRLVLLFTSTDPQAHRGEVCVVDRTSGQIKELARVNATEDAHRVAVQQWVSGGRRIVFHDLRDGEWVVVSVDPATGIEKVLAAGRQVGFGHPSGDLVPLYGPHWAPGEHRNLELLNVASGQIETVLTWQSVRDAFPDWTDRQFGDRPISVFFPVLSPDLERVIFKVATPGTGVFQTKGDSEREGLFCFDLKRRRFLWMRERWGHPAWASDSRSLINVGPTLIDGETGNNLDSAPFPKFSGSHPSFGPDGQLFVTDAINDRDHGTWSVVIGDPQTGSYRCVHTFDNSKGADSWRRNHPHPVFSADGRRIYFNVSSNRWTRLYVAEIGG